MNPIRLTYKGIRLSISLVCLMCNAIWLRILLGVHEVKPKGPIKVKGVPRLHVGTNGKLSIGRGLRMNNGLNHNRIGRQGPCQLIVMNGAELVIGNDVGMSATALICSSSITVGDRVLFGGNVVVYDTDFHSLNSCDRQDLKKDLNNRMSAPVVIEDDVFIGAHSTILKGVTIGKGAIIGACSLVTKDVEAGEVWAGNPAKCIRPAMQKNTAA